MAGIVQRQSLGLRRELRCRRGPRFYVRFQSSGLAGAHSPVMRTARLGVAVFQKRQRPRWGPPAEAAGNSSGQQVRQPLFRQRAADCVDLLRQHDRTRLQSLHVRFRSFAFDFFEVGNARVEVGQLKVKLLDFGVWISPNLIPASDQAHRDVPPLQSRLRELDLWRHGELFASDLDKSCDF